MPRNVFVLTGYDLETSYQNSCNNLWISYLNFQLTLQTPSIFIPKIPDNLEPFFKHKKNHIFKTLFGFILCIIRFKTCIITILKLLYYSKYSYLKKVIGKNKRTSYILGIMYLLEFKFKSSTLLLSLKQDN